MRYYTSCERLLAIFYYRKYREKLPFYGAHAVEEILIIDPQERSVSWLGLTDGEYQPIERSTLIDLGQSDLAEQIDWP